MLDHLVHLDDVPLENQDKARGWTISQFRLPITGKDGSPSALFHGLFQPGSEHSMHLHDRSDELCIYIRGEGLVGAGEDRLRIGPGSARLMPRTVPHFFHNASVGEPAEVFGIYVGATDVAATGYGYCGKPTADDLTRAEQHRDEPLQYPVVMIADTAPSTTDIGWRRTDFRSLLATSNAPPAFCFAAIVAPGGSLAQHRLANVDAYYLVHEGIGVAGDGKDRAELRPGHVWWVAAGSLSWLRNTDPARPLKLFGYYVGAASPEALGYRFEAEAPAA